MNNDQIKRIIGIFLSTVFAILAIANIIQGMTMDSALPRFFFETLLAGIALICIVFTVKITKISGIIHVLTLFFMGFVIIYDTPYAYTVHGEIIVVMGLLVARTYGYYEKRFKLFFFLILGVSILIKITNPSFADQSTAYHYIMYFTLVGFINFFFFLVLNSVEERQKREARVICDRWQKEQVYTEIGKNVFTSFIHDYNIIESYTGLEYVIRQIQEGNLDKAQDMTKNVMEMLLEDDKRIKSVRSRVIISQKDKPEKVNADVFISSLLNKLKNARMSFSDIISYTPGNLVKPEIMIIPIDLVGIIENIIKNSLEATEDMKVKREIRIDLTECNKHLTIAISNNGPKIPWTGKNGVVDPANFRPGNTTKKEGTGWGMYATINRIEDNKGKIKIYSDEKRTVFKIQFPLAKGE